MYSMKSSTQNAHWMLNAMKWLYELNNSRGEDYVQSTTFRSLFAGEQTKFPIASPIDGSRRDELIESRARKLAKRKHSPLTLSEL